MKNTVCKFGSSLAAFVMILSWGAATSLAQQADDYMRALQAKSASTKESDWIFWGDKVGTFTSWTNHSNRLIPVYTFGGNLDAISGENSVYRDESKLEELYGKVPDETFNPDADYFDQTQLYTLQKLAVQQGKKNIIVMIFDGMDWQTTQAAAIYKAQKIAYTQGRGNVLSFQTYDKGPTDFGFCVTSAHNAGSKYDVDSQTVVNIGGDAGGGYNADFGGKAPWSQPGDHSYLLGRRKTLNHIYTDSAASATSIFTGKKTYNGAIGIDHEGNHLNSIAHELQDAGRSVGVVTSVPLSHATPASAYAHNVTRNDYQDLTRDLVGLPSISHREKPLRGMDVVIGCGWGAEKDDDTQKQGKNFVAGNKFLPQEEVDKINVDNGGLYVVSNRTEGIKGNEALAAATSAASDGQHRLLGLFGAQCTHLPYATADGNFDPTRGTNDADKYTPEEIFENPSLAEMTDAALQVLNTNEKGFWLMVEAGDVDWANHNNNIDDAIGAVFSGAKAFDAITNWVETNSSWEDTLLIVTADHGHMMNVVDLERLIRPAAKTVTKKSENQAAK